MPIRRNFERQLGELREDLLLLGRFVQEAHGKAMEALIRQDITTAQQVLAGDDVADEITLRVQALAIQLLALQQPMARDLRIIASALRIVVDLERIGDHAADIAKVARSLGLRDNIRFPVDLPQLSSLACAMVEKALRAFVQHDSNLALQVASDDDAVDDLCAIFQHEFIDLMRADPSQIELATHLLLIARSLERVADHATNIAEQVYFVETGEVRPLGQGERDHDRLLLPEP